MTRTDSRAELRKAESGIEQAPSRDPVVASARGGTPPIAIAGLFLLLAVGLFIIIDGERQQAAASLVAPTATASIVEPPPPLELPKPAPPPPPPPPLTPVVVQQIMTPPPPMPAAAPPDDSAQRLHAPTVVVELQGGKAGPVLAQNTLAPPADKAAAAANLTPPDAAKGESPAAAPDPSIDPTEQFGARISQQSPETSVATQMGNLGTTVIQGATIQALLETAINSDLPGYTRAIVRRDVRGFDGKTVLIPRGSRVIGQYRNAMSLGQSRVFIIWSRVIRPDGVTVQIGSPGGDSLGEGGLTGEVNTHFFARFGGAILMSVLNAGVNAVSTTPSTQITIGSPAAATAAAAAATFPQGTNILPTIEVQQGSPLTIFVARDLDFSTVKPVP